MSQEPLNTWPPPPPPFAVPPPPRFAAPTSPPVPKAASAPPMWRPPTPVASANSGYFAIPNSRPVFADRETRISAFVLGCIIVSMLTVISVGMLSRFAAVKDAGTLTPLAYRMTATLTTIALGTGYTTDIEQHMYITGATTTFSAHMPLVAVVIMATGLESNTAVYNIVQAINGTTTVIAAHHFAVTVKQDNEFAVTVQPIGDALVSPGIYTFQFGDGHSIIVQATFTYSG